MKCLSTTLSLNFVDQSDFDFYKILWYTIFYPSYVYELTNGHY